jgi:signal transduction histidine kinase
MFERIEVSMQQVHTMSGALAHDLRSPLTAIRAKLEMALPMDGQGGVESDEVVSAIDEIDRLTELLTKSLDVAEAKADALRLKRELVDLNAVLRSMEELYGPSFAESGLRLEVESAGAVWVLMDAALLHRMMANLFDNELKHLHAGCVVRFVLESDSEMAVLRVEDDGPGFADQVRTRMFEARVKGKGSSGYGLGLAFVQAVVASHGGMIDAGNEQGAWIVARLPLAAA